MEDGVRTRRYGEVRQFPWLEAMVTALDDRLRLRHGVIEYTHRPDCLFRIQFITSNDDYILLDGTCVCAGAQPLAPIERCRGAAWTGESYLRSPLTQWVIGLDWFEQNKYVKEG